MDVRNPLLVFTTGLFALGCADELSAPVISLADANTITTSNDHYVTVHIYSESAGYYRIEGGDCPLINGRLAAGSNDLVIENLMNGSYQNCQLTSHTTPDGLIQSPPLTLPTFTINDITAPILTIDNNSERLLANRFIYRVALRTTENGEATYADQCQAYKTSFRTHTSKDNPYSKVTYGTSNSLVFIDLPEGANDNCSVTVTDINGNTSAIGAFAEMPAIYDYIKLDVNGTPLADQDKPWNNQGTEANYDQWSCVEDKSSGAVWEIKSPDAQSVRYQDYYQTWYDPASPDGNAGYIRPGEEYTSGYVAAINSMNLCGQSNWQVPSRADLLGLARYINATQSFGDPDYPYWDQFFFPEVQDIYAYWTRDVDPQNSQQAYYVIFSPSISNDVLEEPINKNSLLSTRLISYP